MSDVGDLGNMYLAQNELQASRLIVDTHLLERIVPELLIDIRIEIFVLPREARASRVVHPHIETGIGKEKGHRLKPVTADAST